MQLFVKPGSLLDMAEFVDQDALQSHAALVFEDILLGENHGGPVLGPGQEAPAAPIVEVELLAFIVAAKLREIRGELLVPDENAEHLSFPDPVGYVFIDALHEHVELVGGLAVGVVADPVRGGDDDALDQGGFGIEGGVKLVGARLLFAQRFDPVHRTSRGAGRCAQREEEAREDERKSIGWATMPVL